MFGLISKQKFKDKLCVMLYRMAMSKEALKTKWDDGDISEWGYYKRYWQMVGRISMLEDLIKSL